MIAIATGQRAQTVKELRSGLATISPDSVYYHFWGRLIRPSFDDPEFNNDFAIWAAHGLHDKVLAERLGVVDPQEFNSMEDLRREVIDILEQRIDEIEVPFWSSSDQQFEFVRAQIVIFDTRKQVTHPRELKELLPTLSLGSIFFHFIDARRRHVNSLDDFQNWLANFGDETRQLRERIAQVDPFFTSLSLLREELTEIFCGHFLEASQ